MKKRTIGTIAAALTVATASAAMAAPYSFNAIGQTYTQDFNSYLGTEATLPVHTFVTGVNGNDVEYPDFNPFSGVSSTADTTTPNWGGDFTAFTNGTTGNSFGIRERGDNDLRDSRFYFEFTNNTGSLITGFDISYDVEAWFIGNRRNRLRLKYDDEFGSGRFETDIFSTDNPSAETIVGTIVDGSLSENRVTVSGFVDLSTLPVNVPGDPRDFFGSLAPGETAFFRWQFSNTSGDGGSLRSGLAINNISITAVPEPASLALLAMGGLALLRRRHA